MKYNVITRTHVRQFTLVHTAKCHSTISCIMSSYFPMTGFRATVCVTITFCALKPVISDNIQKYSSIDLFEFLWFQFHNVVEISNKYYCGWGTSLIVTFIIHYSLYSLWYNVTSGSELISYILFCNLAFCILFVFCESWIVIRHSSDTILFFLPPIVESI